MLFTNVRASCIGLFVILQYVQYSATYVRFERLTQNSRLFTYFLSNDYSGAACTSLSIGELLHFRHPSNLAGMYLGFGRYYHYGLRRL